MMAKTQATHLWNHVQSHHWREWRAWSNKRTWRIKKILKPHTRNHQRELCRYKSIKLKLQVQINAKPKVKLWLKIQKHFFKAKNHFRNPRWLFLNKNKEVILLKSWMWTPMSSTMVNSYVERFLGRLFCWRTLVTRTKLWQWAFRKRRHLNVIPSLDNTTETNYHLNIQMEWKLKMLNWNTTVGSLKIPYPKNSKSKSPWRSGHKWAKNSLLLLRLPRTSSSPESYLLSISKWPKANLALKVLRSTWTTIPALTSLRKLKFAKKLMYSFSDTWTTQRSNALSSYSTRPLTLSWSH